MSIWQLLLVIGATVAIYLSSDRIRSSLWILLISFTFAATTVWDRYELPEQYFIKGLSDSLICLAIYFHGKYLWEMALYRIFQASVLLSIIMMSGFIPSRANYVIALEAINWAALLVIGSTGFAYSFSGSCHGFIGNIGDYLRRSFRSLCSQRTDVKWTERW